MANIDERAFVAAAEPICQIPAEVPLMLSYNNCIRLFLNVVDKISLLKVTKEEIQLPTIVVVGDQSGILESLAGTNLPLGQWICTRIPLIMRPQQYSDLKPELYLQFQGKQFLPMKRILVKQFTLRQEIVGNRKGILDPPMTLVVKKGVPQSDHGRPRRYHKATRTWTTQAHILSLSTRNLNP